MYLHSHKTELTDRVLYYDGDSEFTPDEIIKILQRGHILENVYVTNVTKDIEKYNKLVPNKKQIKTKTEVREVSTDWEIPIEYKELDVDKYVVDRFFERFSTNLNKQQIRLRTDRLATELSILHKLNFIPVLKCAIFIINTFENNKLVWGIGRGSAVSSYVLYVIGLHDVDSIKYDISFDDFIQLPNNGD